MSVGFNFDGKRFFSIAIEFLAQKNEEWLNCVKFLYGVSYGVAA
jgi:hypothetical protein